MRFPQAFLAFGFLGLSVATQVAFQSPLADRTDMAGQADFQFKQGKNVLSPKEFIELPRPGSGLANGDGDLVLVQISKYSFEDKKNYQSFVIAPLESSVAGQSLEVPLPDGGTLFWLNSRTLGHVVDAGEDKKKRQDLYAIPVSSSSNSLAVEEPALIGSIPVTTAANFRISAGYLIFSAYVYADGDLKAVEANDNAYEDRGNTALVYDHTFERHWDTWVGPKHQSLFTVTLKQDGGKWVLGEHFVNTLKQSGHSSPVEPFGGTDDFDVSGTQIVYTTKDPSLPPAWHTKQNIYLVDFKGEKTTELTSGQHGATHAPAFNSQGNKIAWLQQDKDGNEADRQKIVIFDLDTNVRFTLTQNWDRSPDTLRWSKSGDFLYLTAGEHARVKVFVLPVPPTPSHSTTDPSFSARYTTPIALTDSHAASGLEVLPDDRLVFTVSSLISPNDVFILRGLNRVEADINNEVPHVYRGELERITSFSANALRGKDLAEGEEFWFKGADDVDVQGWINKPVGWKAGDKKKWPVAFLIHGGPQSAWDDQWSTRWNPNVFAHQGYFTVAINPTGSTTFGQNFTDGISKDWGGKPFVDLRKGWQYILDNYPEVDAERAVAAGASWGGYAINWIQGNPEFGFGFKALVCHDGVFDSNYNGLSTDELFFFNYEWGRPWEDESKDLFLKYSPANTVKKWATPQLLIHGSKDYRLPETDSIAAFHALQELGIPSRLVIFPDENHWVLKPGNSLKWHYEVFKWFDQFVGIKE